VKRIHLSYKKKGHKCKEKTIKNLLQYYITRNTLENLVRNKLLISEVNPIKTPPKLFIPGGGSDQFFLHTTTISDDFGYHH
jgi:hypothetical protein